MKGKIHSGLDTIGMTASLLCAVHCALVPLLLTALPLLGIGFLANEWVEISMIGLSAIIGCIALITTFKRHYSYTPLITLVTGFVLIFTGHALSNAAWEHIMVPLGGLTIAAAHYINWRLYTHQCADTNVIP
ncbi:MerC domain-containing protein [Mucilaginibacter gynuensis]|uniref:MerC domain-containing protein n=1 Tax=Mucilaginibacter gynuensis TaxID=1302236 RepID=A0ABP8HEG4_9SPHI